MIRRRFREDSDSDYLLVEIKIDAKSDVSYPIAKDLNDLFGLYLEGDGKNTIKGKVNEAQAEDLLNFACRPAFYFKEEWEAFNGVEYINFRSTASVFPSKRNFESKKINRRRTREAMDGDIMTFEDFCDWMELSLNMVSHFKAFIKSKDGTEVDDDYAAPRAEWVSLLDAWKEEGDYYDASDDDNIDKDQFSVELVDEEGNVGYYTFDNNGRWIGRFVSDASDPDFIQPTIGLSYMGYLDPQDIALWIRKDVRGDYKVSLC